MWISSTEETMFIGKQGFNGSSLISQGEILQDLNSVLRIERDKSK